MSFIQTLGLILKTKDLTKLKISMKNLFNPIFIFFILFSTSCSVKKHTGETHSIGPKSQGLIEVTSDGYGSTKSASIGNAIENAFKNILIQGIPNSNQVRPLLGNNAISVFEKNKNYFEKFFNNELPKYIMNQKILYYHPMSVNKASSQVVLEIKLDALRQKLQSDHIIATFGI